MANRDGTSELHLFNSVFWANSDNDSGTTTSQEQFYYEAGFTAGDVDNNVIEGCDSDPCAQGGDNTDQDPEFEDEGATTIEWDDVDYDDALGETTFEVDDASLAAAGLLFKPDPNEHAILLIKSINTGTDQIVCYGKWDVATPINPIDGKVFDLHLDTGSSAIDYGDGGHLPTDECDLNGLFGRTDDLPWDLDENDRSQGDPEVPDSGVYETDPG